MGKISYPRQQNSNFIKIKMSELHPATLGVEYQFTILKQTDKMTLFEVERVGIVWYEIHYTEHNRINREYNYLNALKLWNTLIQK